MATLIENQKARFDYEILETFEAGMELRGFEVKALRSKKGSLTGAHVIVRNSEVYALNMHIPPYQPENTPSEYDPLRTRKLLLTKREIELLAHAEAQKGLTIVPLAVYNKGRVIKVSLAIARGKKKYDKRETLKQRESKHDIARTLKNET